MWCLLNISFVLAELVQVEEKMFLKEFNLTAGYHWKSKVFSLLSKMIIYHNFTWLPLFYNRKLISVWMQS